MRGRDCAAVSITAFFLLLPSSAPAQTMVCQKAAAPGTNPPPVWVYINTNCLSGCPNVACDPSPGCLANCCPNGAADCGAVGVDPNNPNTCNCLPYDAGGTDCWYFDQTSFERQVVNAMNLWNLYGGANRIFA